MQELDLTPTQALIFFIVLIGLTIYEWRKISRITYDLELKKSEEEETQPAYLERYGAYIQLSGKRYN